MTESITIDIANDFSPFPAGRNRADGRYSGEAFRDDLLLPALKSTEHVVILFDGAAGYGSSFLEEVFGGLVREHGYNNFALKERLTLTSSDTLLIEEIESYIFDASQTQLPSV